MKYIFHPEARKEVVSATKYYQHIDKKLGITFRKEMDETVARILENPEAWRSIHGIYRRCLLKKFPFGIIYQVEESENICLIFAVMHLHRKPYYWEDRKFS